MRGQGTALALLLVLTIPSGLALGGAGGAGDAAEGTVRWMAPTFGYADHPVHAAVGVYAGDDLVPHATLSITVTLNDVVLVETTFVHEHDGFHPLVVTPAASGTLRFIASLGDHDEREHEADPTTIAPHQTVAEVSILTGTGHPSTGEDTIRIHPAFREIDSHGAVLGANAHVPHQAFVDVSDDDGRLLASYAPWPNGWYTSQAAAPIGGFGNGRVDALFAPHPAVDVTLFTETVSVDVAEPHAGIIRSSYPYPWNDYPASCDAVGVPLVTDPRSSLDAGNVWHTWTDVRFAIATPAHLVEPTAWHGPNVHSNSPIPTVYRIMAGSPTGPVDGSSGSLADFRTSDPFRELALRFREPGHYIMTLETNPFEDGAACTVEFTILPSTDNEPGVVDHSISVRNDTARVQFLAKRDGQVLPHYEFDTRVVKLHTEDTPGRLVWKGKLHGHQGYAMFELGGLDLGTYEVRMYPSPQDRETPPVTAPTDAGFVYRFTVTSVPERDGVVTDVTPAPMAVPAPGTFGFLVLLGLLGLALRRK